MGEWETQLGAILSNQDAMAKIMELAKDLGSPNSSTPQPEPSPPPVTDLSSAADLMGSLDPQIIQEGIRLFSQLSSGEDEKTALLLALRPFLKEERYAKVDRAIQIARLSRVLRVAFRLFQGKGDDRV